MDIRTYRFPVGDGPFAVDIRNAAGSVTVEVLHDTPEYVVEVEPLDSTAEQLTDRVDAFVTDSRLRVQTPERRLLRTPAFAVRVTVPPSTAARVAVASADTELRGPLGRVDLTSASGAAAVEHCEELQLRTASGDARIGRVSGSATLGSASADLHVESVGGTLDARTASGDVLVGRTMRDISIATASGDVGIDRMAAGSVRVKTVSGDVSVAVIPGQRVWLDLSSVSGRMDSQLPGDDDGGDAGPAQLSLILRSVSGDLRIRRVAPAA